MDPARRRRLRTSNAVTTAAGAEGASAKLAGRGPDVVDLEHAIDAVNLRAGWRSGLDVGEAVEVAELAGFSGADVQALLDAA